MKLSTQELIKQQKEIVHVVKQMEALRTEKFLIQDRIDRLKIYQTRIQICYEEGRSFH